MIHIESIGNHIWIKGRKENGDVYEKTITTFKPYFYALTQKETGLKSITGENVERIDCNHPGEVPKLRENYDKTFESDVLFVQRYLIDEVKEIEKEKLRICYLDIETHENEVTGYCEPKDATEPITSIALYDNFLKKYLVFAWEDKFEEETKIDFKKGTKYFFPNETLMLNKFIHYIRDCDPDIVTAYFGDKFDFPYIINRIKKVGFKPECLSPLNEVEERRDSIRIRGREFFDFYWGYRGLKKEELESRSLDYLAIHEKLGFKKIEYEGSLNDLRKNQFEKFIEYNIRDVEIMVAVDEKLKIIDFHDELRRLAKTPWFVGFSTNKIVDSYCLNFCKDKFVLPKTEKGEKDGKYKGGAVFDPLPGIHKNVIASDMKSLYPSIIISLNLSPETLDPNGDITAITGVRTTSKKKGMIPKILEGLFKERDKAKTQMKKYKRKTPEYTRWYSKQYAIKVLMNSFYGAMGNKYFRIYDYRIAETITAMARETLRHCKEVFKEQNCKIVYGDTDSIYFNIEDGKEKTIPEIALLANKKINVVNSTFDKFGKKYGLNNHILDLQFERIFGTVFFKEKTKKRYACRVRYEDGKECDYIKIVGFEAKRSDSPSIARKFQKEFFSLVLMENTKEKILQYCKTFYQKIKKGEFSPVEIGMPVGLSKDPYEYGKEGKGIAIHARAALYSNKFNKTQFKKGDKIKMVFVKTVPNGQLKTNVIAIDGTMPKGYTIDYEVHAGKLCLDKAKGVFKNQGWAISEITGQVTLEEFF